MRDQEIVDLWEAYNGIYEQESATGPRLTDAYDKPPYSDSPKSKATRKGPKMKGVIRQEEVEIAAEYFYEMGLNEDGVDILIEDLGLEGFANFVYTIAEEYYLTEARAGGTKIEPKLASGKAIQGKPKAASLKRLRAQKAARQETENKASASKPSGMKASLERQSAVAAAAKKQPKKPGFLDRVVGAVDAGIKRHNAAMSAAKETGKTISNVAKKVGGVAREVGKGASGAAKLAGHVARKGLSDEYLMGYLIDEGYADTEDAALAILENMSGEWRESIVEEIEQIDEIDSSIIARTDLKRRQNLDAAQERENSARDAGATVGERSKLAANTSAAAAKVSKHRALSTAHARSRSRMNVEEVENWVDSLIEDGYDLSDYTWDEMVEIYLDENKMDKELNTPNWDKVYDRNRRDYGPNHTSKPERRPSGKLETPNQTTQRLGKERVQSHKDTRGVKKIPGAKGIRMQFGRAF